MRNDTSRPLCGTRSREQAGFTLIELMFVVVILAVLSSVAVFSYGAYVRQARIQEALGFLGSIRVRQEMYFSTYSQYVDTSPQDSVFFPTEIYNGGDCNQPSDFSLSCPGDAATQPGWCALGVYPVSGGDNFFQYLSVGWAPGDNPSDCALNKTSVCLVPDESRPWWIAVARGDQLCTTGAVGTSESLIMVSSQIKDPIIIDPGEANSNDDWGSISRQNFDGAIQ